MDCAGTCGGSALGIAQELAVAQPRWTARGLVGSATRDCAGTCGGSATTDCAVFCNGTATLIAVACVAVLQPLIAADVNAVMMAVVVAVGLVPGARVVRMGSVMTSDAERIGIVHPDCHVLVAFAKRARAVQLYLAQIVVPFSIRIRSPSIHHRLSR